MASSSSGVKITQNGDDTDIIIYQGKTIFFEVTWKDADGVAVDVTGYFARLQARTTAAAASAFIDWNDEDGQIEVGDEDGKFTFNIDAADSALIEVLRGGYDFEIETPDGDVELVISGKMTVMAEYTK